ncbi:MAG: hypothetical protein QOE78_3944 [Alphaproteobacteria bacterium]|nr:hypothetical protein [Alphaproteobacteria bacterium]
MNDKPCVGPADGGFATTRLASALAERQAAALQPASSVRSG